MEIIDVLEQKVNSLLEEMASLRQRNTELEQRVHELQANAGQTEQLETLLEEERSKNTTFLSRVDNLVHRLEEHGLPK